MKLIVQFFKEIDEIVKEVDAKEQVKKENEEKLCKLNNLYLTALGLEHKIGYIKFIHSEQEISKITLQQLDEYDEPIVSTVYYKGPDLLYCADARGERIADICLIESSLLFYISKQYGDDVSDILHKQLLDSIDIAYNKVEKAIKAKEEKYAEKKGKEQ